MNNPNESWAMLIGIWLSGLAEDLGFSTLLPPEALDEFQPTASEDFECETMEEIED